MQRCMFFTRENHKVFGPVVSLVAVDVMNNFIACQWTPEHLSHYQAMFRLVPFGAIVIG
jgi:hypothetical protein